MTTETKILTDEFISALWDEIHAPFSRETFRMSHHDFARHIEAAVLQSPEVQALRKDAERYRHLRDEAGFCPHDIFNAWWMSEHGNPQTLDAAIDISMEKQP